jgi:SAM-dependent methyltransferase
MFSSLVSRVLSSPHVYVMAQRAVGAHKLRELCIDTLAPQPGARILDVGCGPAYYIDHFSAVEYYGFDTDEGYIRHARDRWKGRGRFHCEQLSEQRLSELPKFDGVMLMGLLHHLNDAECNALLAMVGGALAPEGRVVALDTCSDRQLTPMARWLAEHDRGEFVRPTRAFIELGAEHFRKVEHSIVGNSWRVPSGLLMMVLSQPV